MTYKRLFAVLLATLMGLGLLTIAATPAQAAVCAPGEFCISKQYGLDPYFRKTPPQAPAGTCVTLPVQDYTRYVENRTQYDWWVYLTGSCSGTRATMQAYTSGPMNADWSDRIRSVMRLSHDDGFAATSPIERGQVKSVPAGGKDIVWPKSNSVPIAYNQAKRAPSTCNDQFGVYESSLSPYGDYRCYSPGVTRNTCIVPSGPIRTAVKNDTQYYWRVFRASDTTCQGASVYIPPNVQGPGHEPWGNISGFDADWSSFRAVSRTSATYNCPPINAPSGC